MWVLMAVTDMQKLTVIGLNSSRTPFLHELMRLGVVEINSQEGVVNDEEWMPDIFRTSNSADVSRLEADIARVSVALDAINRYDTGKKPLIHTRKEIKRNVFVDHMNATKTATETITAIFFLIGFLIKGIFVLIIVANNVINIKIRTTMQTIDISIQF